LIVGWALIERDIPCARQYILKLRRCDGGSEAITRDLPFRQSAFLVITYETDPDLIRAGLPEVEPADQPLVHYEWNSRCLIVQLGSYTESGLVIPARLNGEDVTSSRRCTSTTIRRRAGRGDLGFPKNMPTPSSKW